MVLSLNEEVPDLMFRAEQHRLGSTMIDPRKENPAVQ